MKSLSEMQDFRVGRPVICLSFLLVLPFVASALFIHRESAARMPSAAPFEAIPDLDVDSKRLAVHGPFHYSSDENSAGRHDRRTLLRPIDARGERDSDDFDGRGPGRECGVPARCPERTPAHPTQVPSAPPTRANWTWDIGAGDPQIAAGPDSLLVSAYQDIAYLNKADGQHLPVKSRLVLGGETGQGGIKTGPRSPIGQIDRTTVISTNDLFAPMLDDINANLNLTVAEQKACKASKFDCNVNKFYDTRIIYDDYRSRFWIVSLAMSANINAVPALQPGRRGKLAVAVSKTSDPRDGWNLYWWDSIPNDGHWPPNESSLQHAADYPSLGISPKYVLEEHAAGLYHDASSTVSIVEADPLARGEKPDSQLKAFQFWNFKDPNGAVVTSSIQPAVHHGAAPSLFAAVFASTARDGDQSVLDLYLFNDSSARFFRTEVPIADFFGPRDAPQPATASVPNPFNLQMTNTGNHVMKAVFEDGRIYVTFNDCQSFPGSPGCVTSVRLVRVKIGIPNVVEFDQSIGNRFTDEPQSKGHIFFGMPAVEVNRSGDAAVVFMRSGAHVFPQAAYSVLFHNADGMGAGAVLQQGNDSDTYQEQTCESLKQKCAAGDRDACKDRETECAAPERDLDTAGISVDPADDSIWIADAYEDHGSFRIAVGQILGHVAAHPTKKN